MGIVSHMKGTARQKKMWKEEEERKWDKDRKPAGITWDRGRWIRHKQKVKLQCRWDTDQEGGTDRDIIWSFPSELAKAGIAWVRGRAWVNWSGAGYRDLLSRTLNEKCAKSKGMDIIIVKYAESQNTPKNVYEFLCHRRYNWQRDRNMSAKSAGMLGGTEKFKFVRRRFFGWQSRCKIRQDSRLTATWGMEFSVVQDIVRPKKVWTVFHRWYGSISAARKDRCVDWSATPY